MYPGRAKISVAMELVLLSVVDDRRGIGMV
jgi:hypothetical protein